MESVLVADNAIACGAAMQEAQTRGYNRLLLSTNVQGEAREVARVFAAIANEIAQSNCPIARRACVIAGGETSVPVRGNGESGRSQELALVAAIEIAEPPNAVVLSAGTDWSDGPTDAAGALADGTTLARGATRGLEARKSLSNNDAYNFFQPLDDLIVMGPTKTNVNDVMLVVLTKNPIRLGFAPNRIPCSIF